MPRTSWRPVGSRPSGWSSGRRWPARRGASRSRSSPMPRPTAGACGMRRRTTSTRSSPRSRSCSSGRWRRCTRVANSCRRSWSRSPPTCPTTTPASSRCTSRTRRSTTRTTTDDGYGTVCPLRPAEPATAILVCPAGGPPAPRPRRFSRVPGSFVPGRSTMSALRIDVADLLTHPGARRPVHIEAAVADLGTPVARIVEPVRLDLVLERVPDGIVARGELHARWEGECSACLRELAADLDVGVGELFERRPLDEDTYPIEGHEIDLEQLVRDALVLELPLAPACDDAECTPAAAPGVLVGVADSAPADAAPTDPRWAALSELDL